MDIPEKSGPGSGICEMLAICLQAATIAGAAFYGCRLAPSMRPNAWKEIRGIYWLCYRDLGGVDGGHHTTFFLQFSLRLENSHNFFCFCCDCEQLEGELVLSTIPGCPFFFFFFRNALFCSGIFSYFTEYAPSSSFLPSPRETQSRIQKTTPALSYLH